MKPSLLNRILKNAWLAVALAAIAASQESCKSYLEIPPPTTDLTRTTVFSDASSVEATVNGLYTLTFNDINFWSYAPHFYGGMMADELYPRSVNVFDDLLFNQYNPSTDTYGKFWQNGYKVIYHANSIITGLADVTFLPEILRKRYIAEAKFFRAYIYLLLSGYYGDVPLITTTDIKETDSAPRSPKTAVIALVVADLKDVLTDLNRMDMPKTRANALAAQSLLARVYLYSQQWEEAAAAATAAIAGNARLESALDSVFLRSSDETIWTISSSGSRPDQGDRTTYGLMLLPSPTNLNYGLPKSLYNSFEPGDKRRSTWIGIFAVSPDTILFTAKYKQKSTNMGPMLAEDDVVMRLAEQYLIRAEANAAMGKTSESAADLNVLRRRAGLRDLPASMTKEQLVLQVEKERRAELFVEGHRWFDIVRTGRADAVFGAAKPATWKPHAVLLPIPQAEMDLNQNLVQNPGYQ